MTQCTCPDWLESMPQLDSAVILNTLHGNSYAGARFMYCPWCGKRLEIEQTIAAGAAPTKFVYEFMATNDESCTYTYTEGIIE